MKIVHLSNRQGNITYLGHVYFGGNMIGENVGIPENVISVIIEKTKE